MSATLIAALAVLSLGLAFASGLAHGRLSGRRAPAQVTALADGGPSPAGTASSTADERWTAFLIGMSQELRTALDSIIGFAEMLSEANLGPPHEQQARLIMDSGKGMLRLLNDILDIAQIRAGQLRLVEERADIRTELDQVVTLLQPIAASRNLDLTVKLAGNLPDCWAVDRLRLRQIVLELVGNAIKHAGHGRIAITAKVGGKHLIITVSDTGAGISPALAAEILSPFRSPRAQAERQESSANLGLAICADLARLMGGHLALETSPGQGSNLVLFLPLNCPEDKASQANKLPANSAPHRAPDDDCDVTRLPEGNTPTIHALELRYRQRKQNLLSRMGKAASDGAREEDLTAIMNALHQIANVAANFGDVQLGKRAAELYRALANEPDCSARQQLIVSRWPGLRESA